MHRMLKKLTLSIVTAIVALISLAAAPANAQDRNVQVINETQHGIVQSSPRKSKVAPGRRTFSARTFCRSARRSTSTSMTAAGATRVRLQGRVRGRPGAGA